MASYAPGALLGPGARRAGTVKRANSGAQRCVGAAISMQLIRRQPLCLRAKMLIRDYAREGQRNS